MKFRSARWLMMTAQLVVVVALVLPISACGKKDSSELPAGRSYKVRGKVDSIAADRQTIFIHHEKIPAFHNAFGETAAMNSMTMGFSVDAVSLDGVDRGDPVEFSFHTDWKAKPALRLDALSKLPPETELELGDAH